MTSELGDPVARAPAAEQRVQTDPNRAVDAVFRELPSSRCRGTRGHWSAPRTTDAYSTRTPTVAIGCARHEHRQPASSRQLTDLNLAGLLPLALRRSGRTTLENISPGSCSRNGLACEALAPASARGRRAAFGTAEGRIRGNPHCDERAASPDPPLVGRSRG